MKILFVQLAEDVKLESRSEEFKGDASGGDVFLFSLATKELSPNKVVAFFVDSGEC
jgi:hypothetical protein